MQKTISLNVAILSVKGNGYWTDFCYMSKNEAIDVSKNSDLVEKCEIL